MNSYISTYIYIYIYILQKDWGAQVVPFNWQEASTRTPIKTIDWMVEAELKHGRIAVRTQKEGYHI